MVDITFSQFSQNMDRKHSFECCDVIDSDLMMFYVCQAEDVEKYCIGN